MANSLTVSNKAETGEGRYNLRVVECRLAAIALALALGKTKVGTLVFIADSIDLEIRMDTCSVQVTKL